MTTINQINNNSNNIFIPDYSRPDVLDGSVHDASTKYTPIIAQNNSSVKLKYIDPYEINNEMISFAEKVSSFGKNDEEKAATLFISIVGKGKSGLGIEYNDDPGIRSNGIMNPAQVFKGINGKRYAQCMEYSLLYVALARQIGLKANIVDVKKDFLGEEMTGFEGHICAAVYLNGQRVLVDLAIPKFGVEHKEAIDLNDQEATVYFYLNNARYLSKNSKPDLAEAEIRKALEINPNSSRCLLNLGYLLTIQRNFHNAELALKKAIALDPNLAEAHYNLGGAYLTQNKIDLAIEEFKEATRLDQKSFEAYNNLGVCYSKKNQPWKAVEEFIHALKVKPDFLDAHINLSEIYFDAGKNNETIEAVSNALEFHPEHPKLNAILGSSYCMIGDLDSGIKYLQKSVDINPEYSFALASLGFAHANKGNLEEAENILIRAIKIDPKDARAHFFLSLVYKKTNKTKQSEEEAKIANELGFSPR